MAWAVAQAVMAVVVVLWAPQAAAGTFPTASWPFLALTVLTVVAYFWVGTQLRTHAARVRTAAIVLSILALLSFPVGTAIGAYGLWTLFKHREAGVHHV
jgi:hypothetical protein